MASAIRQKGQMSLAALRKQWPHADGLLRQLEAAELVRQEVAFVQQGSSKEEFIYESCVAAEELEAAQQQLKRAVRQWEVLRFLTYEGPCDGKVLHSYWPGYLSLIKELEKKQLVRRQKSAGAALCRRQCCVPQSSEADA